MRRYSCVLAVLSMLALPSFGQNYVATLSGAQEVPGVVTGASGSATLTLNAAQDTLTYNITLVGVDLDGMQTPMDATDDVIAMHIHAAPAGINGGVVFGLINPGHDLDDLVIDAAAGTVSGAWEATDNNGNATLASQLAALNADGLYFNVHTVANQGGEIRGQIIRPLIAVPAASKTGLIALSVLLLAAAVVVLWRRSG